MLNPIPHFAVQLLISGLPKDVVNGLVTALNSPLIWREVPASEMGDEENVNDGRFWEAISGEWKFLLSDFSVAEQPNHKPGDRGQNFSLINAKRGMVLLSDGILYHALGAWFLEKLQRACSKPG